MKNGIKNMTYCIHSFMSAELGLGGNELLVYAIIYSFSRGAKGLFYGTQDYLVEAIGGSISTVKRTLSSLLGKGLIERCKADKSEGCRDGYRATYTAPTKTIEEEEDAPSNDAAAKVPTAIELEDMDMCVADFLEDTTKPPRYELLPVGSEGIVAMTAEQHKRLIELVGSEELHAYVRRLELLMLNKGYRTFNPYKTIKKWIYDNCSL